MSIATAVRPQLDPRPVINTGSATSRTGIVLLGALLASLPLLGLFERGTWLPDAWITMALVLAPAAALRHRRAPRMWHLLPGLVLAGFWLTNRFVGQHALLGLIPTRATGSDVATRFDQLRTIIHDSSVPVEPAAPVVFVLCLVLALFAALVDLLAVVARRAALAGIPMLVVYVVAGAILRSSVHWLLFAGAAAGFLLMLTVNARDEFARWGPLVPRYGEDGSRVRLAVSGQRIGVLGILCALALAAIAPVRAGNSLSDVFGGSGSGGGLFGVTGGGSQIDPFAALKGQLSEPRATPLLQVHVTSAGPVNPFYLRTLVLTAYDSKGWHQGDQGPALELADNQFDTNPTTDTSQLPSQTFTAQMKVLNLRGTPAIFSQPAAVHGFGNGAQWLPDLGLVQTKVEQFGTYNEVVHQPNPSADYLTAADGFSDDAGPVAAPTFPASVRLLVRQITAGATTRYAKARAISDYFTNPANGFTYSLQTKAGDSGSDLVDFLTNKSGYCQQYAAVMAIMLLIAGIPARVVLGYTHTPPQGGTFTVNSTDAHAWVEGFLPGAGWLPFDPTPITGGVGGATTSLAWAPHPQTQITGPSGATGPPQPSGTHRAGDLNPEGTGSAAIAAGANSASANPWPGRIIVLLLIAAAIAAVVPAVVRRRRRWRRLRAGRDGDTDALWRELSATAEDLGYVWSVARTPRQVVGWLGQHTEPESLSQLAGAVESARYAPTGPTAGTSTIEPGELVSDLRRVEAGLRSERGWAMRLRAVLLPHSLRWPLPGQQRRR